MSDEFTIYEMASTMLQPRPGWWWERWDGFGPDVHPRGDGRQLDQHQTDCLIARELRSRAATLDVDDAVIGATAAWSAAVQLVVVSESKRPRNYIVSALQQRGGVHSDPLVRALARREFGDRDELWLEQPICACGHEALLHPTDDTPQHQHRCEYPGERECTCTATRRNAMHGSCWPLVDAAHVRRAIATFHTLTPQLKRVMRPRILAAAREFGVDAALAEPALWETL